MLLLMRCCSDGASNAGFAPPCVQLGASPRLSAAAAVGLAGDPIRVNGSNYTRRGASSHAPGLVARRREHARQCGAQSLSMEGHRSSSHRARRGDCVHPSHHSRGPVAGNPRGVCAPCPQRRCGLCDRLQLIVTERGPPPPSRTKRTRVVHPSVLTGHVSSLSPIGVRGDGRGVRWQRLQRLLPQRVDHRRPAGALPSPQSCPPLKVDVLGRATSSQKSTFWNDLPP